MVPSPNHSGPIIDRDATAHWDGRLPPPSLRSGPLPAADKPRPWPLSRCWTTAPPTARSPSDGPGSPTTIKMETTELIKKSSTARLIGRQVQGRVYYSDPVFRPVRYVAVVWRRGWGSIGHRRRPRHYSLSLQLGLTRDP